MSDRVAGWRRQRRISSTEDAYAFHRQWFGDVQQRVAAGEPFAIISAEVPLEILRAMDIPYVMIQWWSSLVSAKQKAPSYLGELRARGWPDDQAQYFALSFASCFETDPASAPWGGLPKPTLIIGDPRDDDQGKIYELWAREIGATYFAYERTNFNDAPDDWWALGARQWDRLLDPAMLDLHVAQSHDLIRILERETGRRFSLDRFREVLQLVNEQEEWFRRTRDLVAATCPSPISVTDTFTSVMMLQWHRGTEWGRDRARAFYEEVAARVSDGAPACPQERVRLQWIGAGLWFDTDFYDSFMDDHGAVFVWSMYLALAADAYIREDQGDPLRTLAARYVAFIQYLEMEPWPSGWYLKEALAHGVDGAVAIEASPHVEEAFRRAGIPFLVLGAHNVDSRRWDSAAMRERVARFIEEEAAPHAALRRAAA